MTSEEVHDPSSFAKFVATLRHELIDAKAAQKWENADLPRFLEAMSAWAVDWKMPANANPWRHAADLLEAATIYE